VQQRAAIRVQCIRVERIFRAEQFLNFFLLQK
jgi:hypothetical protein